MGPVSFGEYVVEGVDVDVMVDFSILKDGKEYPLSVKERKHRRSRSS
jgi:hypothetical protein